MKAVQDSVAAYLQACTGVRTVADRTRARGEYPLLAVSVREDGTVLGYAELSVILDEGCLEKIAVDPKYRRQGVAEELLGAFLRFGRANLAFITLEVRESNAPAIALYEKLGFQQVGRRKNYYAEVHEDAILMTVEFDRIGTV